VMRRERERETETDRQTERETPENYLVCYSDSTDLGRERL